MLHTTEYDNQDPRTTRVVQTVTIDPVEIFTNCIANNPDYYGPLEGILNTLFEGGHYTLLTDMLDAAEHEIDVSKIAFPIYDK